MKSENYTPVYDETVTQFHSGTPDIQTPINPAYCLMMGSAMILRAILKDGGQAGELYTAPPYPVTAGNPFDYNHPVPWLAFTNGEKRNAAQLASYWANPQGNPMPGVPKAEALNYALVDISTPVGV